MRSFADALAIERVEPLLFKGNEFAQTGVRRAVNLKIRALIRALFLPAWTLLSLGYLLIFWISIHLLSFRGCADDVSPEPCETVLPRVFFLQALLPTFALWTLVAWLTLRRWKR